MKLLHGFHYTYCMMYLQIRVHDRNVEKVNRDGQSKYLDENRRYTPQRSRVCVIKYLERLISVLSLRFFTIYKRLYG